MSQHTPISIDEHERRRTVVTRFVSTAVDGDVHGFMGNMIDIDWSGAWLDIFRMLSYVPRMAIDDAIRFAFLVCWRGNLDLDLDGLCVDNRPMGADWSIERDLTGNTALLVRCLKILMLDIPIKEPPLVLYRGQSLADHQDGQHGVWWSACPIYAEWFARAGFRGHVGQGAVLVALYPADAIIHRLNDMEFLIDPSKLGEVKMLDAPPRYTGEAADMNSLEFAQTSLERDAKSRLLGVPAASQTTRVHEWIELGTPLAGLDICREERAAYFARELAARGIRVAA